MKRGGSRGLGIRWKLRWHQLGQFFSHGQQVKGEIWLGLTRKRARGSHHTFVGHHCNTTNSWTCLLSSPLRSCFTIRTVARESFFGSFQNEFFWMWLCLQLINGSVGLLKALLGLFWAPWAKSVMIFSWYVACVRVSLNLFVLLNQNGVWHKKGKLASMCDFNIFIWWMFLNYIFAFHGFCIKNWLDEWTSSSSDSELDVLFRKIMLRFWSCFFGFFEVFWTQIPFIWQWVNTLHLKINQMGLFLGCGMSSSDSLLCLLLFSCCLFPHFHWFG